MSNPMLTVVREIVTAAGQADAFDSAKHFSLRIDNEPWERLVIESWPVSGADSLLSEKCHISVAHYYIQNGDLMADPEMVMTDTGQPLSYQLDSLGIFRRCYWRNEVGQVMVNRRERNDQLEFLRMWARNLREQGFIEAARRMRE
jgi:hypothetical protein